MIRLVGANFRTAPLELRERLAWPTAAVPDFLARCQMDLGSEIVLLSTCNRTEIYFASSELPSVDELIRRIANDRQLDPSALGDGFYIRDAANAVHHLFRVAAGLDSLVVGESQIAGQAQTAYELAVRTGTVGPTLHAAFQHTRQVVKRIRAETRLAEGKVSVASLAIDHLRQVFDRFDSKIVLVIGTGKMGAVALRHLQTLGPGTILVANRSPEKALAMASACNGQALPWERLDDGLRQAHIVLSATGASEPILTCARFDAVRRSRGGRHVVILDLAVPRDVEPAVAEFEEVDLLVNVDDLQQLRADVLRERARQVPAAEAIVAHEVDRFMRDWSRRWAGPAIAALHAECDTLRHEVESQCLARLNGKLDEADKQVVAGALRLLQNKLLHAPISAVQDEAQSGKERGLFDALIKLFRLKT
ncbi:MAG TPA: glutamyl-tRNA reductase [Gemmatales bacterium]|nr:glutamyl-tRNA reductase [Gemmatales bacterium]